MLPVETEPSEFDTPICCTESIDAELTDKAGEFGTRVSADGSLLISEGEVDAGERVSPKVRSPMGVARAKGADILLKMR